MALSPRYFFIGGGAIAPLPPRIDATGSQWVESGLETLKTNHIRTCGTESNESLCVLANHGSELTADWQTRQKQVDEVMWSNSTDVEVQILQNERLQSLNTSQH